MLQTRPYALRERTKIHNYDCVGFLRLSWWLRWCVRCSYRVLFVTVSEDFRYNKEVPSTWRNTSDELNDPRYNAKTHWHRRPIGINYLLLAKVTHKGISPGYLKHVMQVNDAPQAELAGAKRVSGHVSCNSWPEWHILPIDGSITELCICTHPKGVRRNTATTSQLGHSFAPQCSSHSKYMKSDILTFGKNVVECNTHILA